jgi:hypothetical protein
MNPLTLSIRIAAGIGVNGFRSVRSVASRTSHEIILGNNAIILKPTTLIQYGVGGGDRRV